MSEGKLLESFILGDFPAAIWEHSLGHLCGYLGIPPMHPWYGHHYDDLDVDVHGGLTFGAASRYGHPATVAWLAKREAAATGPSFYTRRLALEQEHAGQATNYPIETEMDIWWLGFDCAHSGDASRPGSGYQSIGGGVFRDESYVRGELADFARQAAAATIPAPSVGDTSACQDCGAPTVYPLLRCHRCVQENIAAEQALEGVEK